MTNKWKYLKNKSCPKTISGRVHIHMKFVYSVLNDIDRKPKKWTMELDIIYENTKKPKTKISNETFNLTY